MEEIKNKEKLDKFVESYFGIYYGDDFWDFLNPRSRRKHRRYLVEKYGKEIIDKWRALSRSLHKEKVDDIDFDDFVYQHGLSDDIIPKVVNRTKVTLHGLLARISKNDGYFTAVDLGSGDGRIATGLALYLDNLEKIYAVEENRYAIQKAKVEVDKLGNSEKQKVNERVNYVLGDFLTNETHEKLIEKEPEGFDFVIAANVPSCLEAIPVFTKITKPNGTILVAASQEVCEHGAPCVAGSFLNLNNERGEKHGVEFKVFGYAPYGYDSIMLILEGRRFS